jgi:hypothetical protein
MTQDDKWLISLALVALATIDPKSVNLRTKKPANALTLRAFILVAGARNHLNLLLTANVTL